MPCPSRQRWAHGNSGRATVGYTDTKRIVHERTGVFVDVCWSTWAKRKEFSLSGNDSVASLQEVSKVP